MGHVQTYSLLLAMVQVSVGYYNINSMLDNIQGKKEMIISQEDFDVDEDIYVEEIMVAGLTKVVLKITAKRNFMQYVTLLFKEVEV